MHKIVKSPVIGWLILLRDTLVQAFRMRVVFLYALRAPVSIITTTTVDYLIWPEIGRHTSCTLSDRLSPRLEGRSLPRTVVM